MELGDNNNNEITPEIGTPKTLADLRKELTKGAPAESMVPSKPTNETDLADVGDEYEKHFPHKREPTPLADVWFGDKMLNLARLHEMGTCASNKFPAFGVLYEFPNELGLKLVVVELPEGIDPMKIAKAVKWGVASEISPAVVHIYAPERFLTMTPFKQTDLVDRPVLAVHKTAMTKQLTEELTEHYGVKAVEDKGTIDNLTHKLTAALDTNKILAANAKTYLGWYNTQSFRLKFVVVAVVVVAVVYFIYS